VKRLVARRAKLKQAIQMLRKIVMAALLAAAGPALAEPLKPTGKWTVDYAVSRCAASRPFGPGKEPLTLTVIPAHSGGSAKLVLANAWTELKVDYYTAAIDFMDGGKPFRTDASPGMGGGRPIVSLDLPVNQVARLRKSQSLRIASGGILDRTLDIGNVGPLFQALDKCLADLRAYWSIDTAPLTMATPAHDLARLFSWSNYPTVGDHRAKTSRVTAQLLIDEKGNVRDCSIITGTGSAALDVQTCQVFERRTQFRPALDQSGKPVRSAVNETITWRR
jgi:TonB family protein